MSGIRRKNAAGLICKIALRTVPRCGLSTILLMCVGLYFLFPARQAYAQVRQEKAAPCELIAATSEDVFSLDRFLAIDGIERVSPLIRFDSQITYQDYDLSCQVKAVYSAYLNLELAEGNLYPDDSSMPYLLLNTAAAQAFSKGEDGEDGTVTVPSGASVTMTMNGSERTAAICGIFEDGSQLPTVYMSYGTASKFFSHTGSTELCFALSSKGVQERVVSSLARYWISADYDTNEALRWELLTQQALQGALTSAMTLLSAAILLREKCRREQTERKSELQVLMLSGLTQSQIRVIVPLRLVFQYLLSFAAAAGIACLLGTFSAAAVVLCGAVLCVHFMLISARKK